MPPTNHQIDWFLLNNFLCMSPLTPFLQEIPDTQKTPNTGVSQLSRTAKNVFAATSLALGALSTAYAATEEEITAECTKKINARELTTGVSLRPLRKKAEIAECENQAHGEALEQMENKLAADKNKLAQLKEENRVGNQKLAEWEQKNREIDNQIQKNQQTIAEYNAKIQKNQQTIAENNAKKDKYNAEIQASRERSNTFQIESGLMEKMTNLLTRLMVLSAKPHRNHSNGDAVQVINGGDVKIANTTIAINNIKMELTSLETEVNAYIATGKSTPQFQAIARQSMSNLHLLLIQNSSSPNQKVD